MTCLSFIEDLLLGADALLNFLFGQLAAGDAIGVIGGDRQLTRLVIEGEEHAAAGHKAGGSMNAGIGRRGHPANSRLTGQNRVRAKKMVGELSAGENGFAKP